MACQSVVALHERGDDLVGVLPHLVAQAADGARHGVDTGEDLVFRAADRGCELRDVHAVAVERLHDHLLALARAVVAAAEQPTVAVAEDGSDDDQSDDVLEAPVVAEEAPVAVVEHAHQVGGATPRF